MNIYAYSSGKRIGPFDLDGLRKELLKGSITPSTLVWHNRLPEWRRLDQLLNDPEALSPARGNEMTYTIPEAPSESSHYKRRVRVRRPVRSYETRQSGFKSWLYRILRVAR